MNKSELVEAVGSTAGVDKRVAERTVEAFVDTVMTEVRSGNKVTLIGFGTFSPKARAARMGRNPATGEPVRVKASKGVGFSAGSAFKTALNSKGSGRAKVTKASPSRASAPRASAPKGAPGKATTAAVAARSSPAKSSPAKSSPSRTSPAKAAPARSGTARAAAAKSSPAKGTAGAAKTTAARSASQSAGRAPAKRR